MIARLFMLKISIARDPDARAYTDRALTPVGDDDDASLDLLTKTAGASAAIAHVRRVAELTSARSGERLPGVAPRLPLVRRQEPAPLKGPPAPSRIQ
jgi:hypothetical protein